MAGPKKSWVLVQGSKCSPDGPLCLGQILTDPYQPQHPLLPDGPPPISQSMIEFSHEDPSVHTTGSTIINSFGIWSVISFLPNRDIKRIREISNSSSWEFTQLDSQTFFPRLSYVTEALNSDSVLEQIKQGRFDFRKSLFMVTGVRVARGARPCKDFSEDSTGTAKVGIDPAIAGGVVLTAGVKDGIDNPRSTFSPLLGASDFVYAYRLAEISYSRSDLTNVHGIGETYYMSPFDMKVGTTGDSFDLLPFQENGYICADGDGENSSNNKAQQQLLVEDISTSDFHGGRKRQPIMVADFDEYYYPA